MHPGYGFLSENSAFVGELEKRGVTFIGPSAYAMNALGDKIHSKELAIKAGVRTVPGFVGDVPTPDDAVRVAKSIGYPVMVSVACGVVASGPDSRPGSRRWAPASGRPARVQCPPPYVRPLPLPSASRAG